MDQNYAAVYKTEEQVSILLQWFTLLSAVIACLGLFGLATFSANKRGREMGIRKVLGASPTSIFILLTNEFLKLILLSVIVSLPISWWLMNSWLNNFSYRVRFGPSIFILAVLAITFVTFFAISFQSIKAALFNPVKTLRNE